jgi:alpha-galactosidase
VDQDALGQCARVVQLANAAFAMIKDLEAGAKAVGLFNPGDAPATVIGMWPELGLKGRLAVRDMWRQKALGREREQLTAMPPLHGVRLVRLQKQARAAWRCWIADCWGTRSAAIRR